MMGLLTKNMKKICGYCEKEFETDCNHKKYCCDYCKGRYKKHRMKKSEWDSIINKKVYCSFCGQLIVGRKNTKPKLTNTFCSDKCSNRFAKHKKQPLPESGFRICNGCGKEYYYTKGQMNWGKNKPKEGGGGIRSDLYCCWDCGQKISNQRKTDTCKKHYGVTNPLKNKEIQQKAYKTYKEKTGYLNPSQNPSVQMKKEETCMKNFGVKSPSHSKKIRKKQIQTLIKNFGCINPSQSETIKNKKRATMKKNNSYNKSKEEEYINKILCEKFGEVKRQYVSKVYPFACDFYIPSLNLYIEYQGYWAHGNEPYNKNNIEHQKILQNWTNNTHPQYKNAIKTWTTKDPLKRNTARKNNLNWIEFFTIDQFMEWYNNN